MQIICEHRVKLPVVINDVQYIMDFIIIVDPIRNKRKYYRLTEYEVSEFYLQIGDRTFHYKPTKKLFPMAPCVWQPIPYEEKIIYLIRDQSQWEQNYAHYNLQVPQL